jgi:APA family basic amino acid/polyamine antiporter
MTDQPHEADATASQPDGSSLGLVDAMCLVVGIVVGTSIFRGSPAVFQYSAGPWTALVIWTIGGVLSLIGALCYAELATTYPRSGGDYEYLSRAFGSWAGFLFGWAQLTAVFAANLGVMAYAFGDYGVELFGLDERAVVWLAVAAIVGMSALNAFTVVAGAWTQNLLTFAKVAGLTAVVIAGLWAASGNQSNRAETSSNLPGDPPGAAATAPAEDVAGAGDAPQPLIGLALVFVLYAYGGWSDGAFVAAEVRNRRRNLPLALVGGVAAITLIYLAVNIAFLAALGFDDASSTKTPASDVLARTVGPIGAKAVSALVMISALGAINGMILSRARVFAVLGADHRALAWLGGWKPGQGTPRASLAAQAGVTLLMVLAVGTERGRRAIDAALAALHAPPIDWAFFGGGFETLLAASAPVFWALFLMTGLAMMVLRHREPDRKRPFQAPLYPITPLVFCATSAYMLYSSVAFARWLAVAGAVPVLAGLLLYAATRKR